jgi:hypothetical protein
MTSADVKMLETIENALTDELEMVCDHCWHPLDSDDAAGRILNSIFSSNHRLRKANRYRFISKIIFAADASVNATDLKKVFKTACRLSSQAWSFESFMYEFKLTQRHDGTIAGVRLISSTV